MNINSKLELGNTLNEYKETIDAVFEALQENMPSYLQFAGDDRAALFEAAIVDYLLSCDA